MNPGVTVFPLREIKRVFLPARAFIPASSPTFKKWPPLMATARAPGLWRSIVIIFPPQRMMSAAVSWGRGYILLPIFYTPFLQKIFPLSDRVYFSSIPDR
jgi:type IV secretory pathway protease TraF